MTSVIDAARESLELGIYPLPILPWPPMREWQNLRLTVNDLPKYFSNGNGIGLLCGIPPFFLADVDVDCHQALLVSRILLPPETKRVFGHKSKPRSHFLYRAPAEFPGQKFLDATPNPTSGKPDTLIELRGKGQQTNAPPTIHISGEPITYDEKGDFGAATLEGLTNYVRAIAAAALAVRHWPAGPIDVRAGQGAVRHYRAVKSDGPDDLVFQSGAKGAPMRDNNILCRYIKPAARSMGIGWVNWLVFRRSHATRLKMAGADVKDAQAQMRHSRASTTLDIYQQFVPASQRQAVDRLTSLSTSGLIQ